MREAAEATLRHPPPRSPDLDPVERASAMLEAPLRAEAARTAGALRAAMGRLLGRFPPAECARHLAHGGYGRCRDLHAVSEKRRCA